MEEGGTWEGKMREGEQEKKWEKYQPTWTTCDRVSY